MLALDSLVIDLIFQADVEIDPEPMVEALGGEELASVRKILDPDMQDPRFEMELSPSMPFRRRGERRLLIVDDSVAPMRKDPRTEHTISLDLRPEKQRLLAICKIAPIRFGRIMALGSWGDAVMVARDARDFRAMALLPWVLDPTVDEKGKKRGSRLTQAEFEAKIMAYEKRLDELTEKQILADLGPATFVRDGELMVLDVLEPDGTWNLRKSLELEMSLAAIEKFSLFPGAPWTPGEATTKPQPKPQPKPVPAPDAAPAKLPTPAPAADATPLATAEIGGRVVLIFPADRFDRDVAAALGKKDYEAILLRSDNLPGQVRDRIHADGAGFIAPLEFLSEVFVDGVPLSRPLFDDSANALESGARSLEVHCPRFGPVLLVDIPERGRFISSERDSPAAVLALIARS